MLAQGQNEYTRHLNTEEHNENKKIVVMVNLRRSVLYMVLQETVHVCSNPKEIKTGTLGLSELAIPVA